MERCEHRHLAEVYDEDDIIKISNDVYNVKENAKPACRECQDCGAKVTI